MNVRRPFAAVGVWLWLAAGCGPEEPPAGSALSRPPGSPAAVGLRDHVHGNAERTRLLDVEAPAPEGQSARWREIGAKDVTGQMVFQEGAQPSAGYTMDGTTAWAYNPNTTFGTDINLGCGRNGAFGWPYLRFDLSALPQGIQVTSATLSVYVEDIWAYCVTGQNVSTHKVLSAWSESTLTYNNKPPDWDNGIFESNTYVDAYPRFFDFSVTQMVSDWVANPASNFGLALIPVDLLCDGDWIIFSSDDSTTTSFRPKLTVNYNLPTHRASFASQSPPPASMVIGQRAPVEVRFVNQGYDDWTPAAGYALGSQSPPDNTTWGFSRIALPATVSHGGTAVFSAQVTAPASPGSYTFQWRMVQEGVDWFGDTSPAVQVQVLLKPNGAACESNMECDSAKCVDGVCCDSTCLGTCKSCRLSGYEGNCRYIGAGQDPDEECPGTGVCGGACDGAGACAFPAAGLACAPCGTCNGQGLCNQFAAPGSDPGDACGPCRVCPGDGPDCAPVPAGEDPFNECAETAPESCGTTGACNGQGACALHAAGTACGPESCTSGLHHLPDRCDGAGACQRGQDVPCSPYVCLDAVNCRTDCADNSHCVAESFCDAGRCRPTLGRGEACIHDGQCLSTHCADGVCCDTVCGGRCEFCAMPFDRGGCYAVPDGEDPREVCPGTGICGGVCNGARECRFPPPSTRCDTCKGCDGAGFCAVLAAAESDPFGDCGLCRGCSGVDTACRPIVAGADPRSECPDLPVQTCGTSGGCDGAGACAWYPSGTECVAASCQDGVLQPASSCDGVGRCQTPEPVPCAPFACAADDRCATACADDSGCLTGYYCQAPVCLPILGPGEACQRAAQCQTGLCVDGVCCQGPCDGFCQRCDIQGSRGQCTAVPPGDDPDNECEGGGACGGACDGAGGCAFPGEEKPCGACARCDGAGNCGVFLAAGTDPLDACGPCRVCAGGRDACVPVGAGVDPFDECAAEEPTSCGRDGLCDGRGACRLWPSGTLCGSQFCRNGTLTRAPTCDGAGACVDRGSVSCQPFACDGDDCGGPASLHHVSVEDAPGGRGVPVLDRTLSTDDVLFLYAVGRDANNVFVGDVLVRWRVDGEIGAVPLGPSTAAVFDPTLPGQGRVVADYYLASVIDGQTGLLRVGPGVPAGDIPVSADPVRIPADGVSTSAIAAGPVRDADHNPVADGTRFTALVSAGEILGDDLDPDRTGLQLATTDGSVRFAIRAPTRPTRAWVRVSALPPGNADGRGVLYFGTDEPVADAGADREAHIGSLVVLDGSRSYDPLGQQLGFFWTQQQGEAVELAGASTSVPTFVAPSSDQTLVFALEVSAGARRSAPDTVEIRVRGAEPQRPRAVLRLDPESGAAPLTVTLDGSESSAADGETLRAMFFEFGDGFASQPGPVAQRTFSEPGGVGVTLWVLDDQGRFDTAAGLVRVGDGDRLPPALTLRAAPAYGPAPLSVLLVVEATCQDGSAPLLEWDLGGGFVPGPAQRREVFAHPGYYPVRVRACDESPLCSEQRLTIAVSDEGAYPPRILSNPPTQAAVGKPYAYAPEVAGTRPLHFSLGKMVNGATVRAPRGMRLDEQSGALAWTPDSSAAPAQAVTLAVQNDVGADFQDFEIGVSGGSASGCACGNGADRSGLLALALWLAPLARAQRRRR
ncbi:MAG: DNRLRE domain-containing protein [Myxococcales bacterium]|nr:DNRLRE domain-containing protein [Myxococcales bacterium]